MYYAIVDASGSLVSEGSSIDRVAIAQKGLTAYEVDGPQNGRPWDNAAKAWGVRTSAVKTNPVTRARTLYATATTDSQRIEALAVALGVKD